MKMLEYVTVKEKRESAKEVVEVVFATATIAAFIAKKVKQRSVS